MVSRTPRREQTQQAGANRCQELGDVEGSELPELDEVRWSFVLLGEDAIESDDVKVWIVNRRPTNASETPGPRL